MHGTPGRCGSIIYLKRLFLCQGRALCRLINWTSMFRFCSVYKLWGNWDSAVCLYRLFDASIFDASTRAEKFLGQVSIYQVVAVNVVDLHSAVHTTNLLLPELLYFYCANAQYAVKLAAKFNLPTIIGCHWTILVSQKSNYWISDNTRKT